MPDCCAGTGESYSAVSYRFTEVWVLAFHTAMVHMEQSRPSISGFALSIWIGEVAFVPRGTFLRQATEYVRLVELDSATPE